MKKIFKKSVCFILAVLMIFGSSALSSVINVYADVEEEVWSNTQVTFGHSVSFDKRIVINGDVILNVNSGITHTFNKGITVASGAKLTINGSGTVNVSISDEGYAGIGGTPSSPNAGTIIINGTTLTVTGGSKAAAIGGGFGSTGGSGGSITINGGTVYATAPSGGGAAIGGARNGNGGVIVINCGKVEAREYNNQGAAIGAGLENGVYDVTINGGNVLAYKDGVSSYSGSAAIGTGGLEPEGLLENGVFRFNGGNVSVPYGYVGSGNMSRSTGRIELSWTNLTDSIYVRDRYFTKHLVLKKYFLDQGNTTYEPKDWELVYDDPNVPYFPKIFEGKTLTPGVKTVEFYSDEDTLFSSSIVPIGETVSRPAEEPTWQYGTFFGWFDSYHDREADYATDAFNFDKPIMDDTKIYAGWTRNNTIVRLLSEGWSSWYVLEVVVGDEVSLPTEEELEAAGQTIPAHKHLSHWIDASGKKYDSGYTFTAEDKQYIFQAVWELDKHSVTFVDDDGTVLKETKEYTYGTPASQIDKPADPVKENTAQYTYRFTGWSPAISDVTEDVTYTATYSSTVNKYTVTFVNEGSVVKTEEVEYGQSATAPELTKQYFTLSWDKDFSNITGDLTVNAVWNVYRVTIYLYSRDDMIFSHQAAHFGVDSGEYYTFPTNKNVFIETEKPVPDHMEIAGWRLKDTGEILEPGAVIRPEAHVDAYAVWAMEKHNITFVDEDGTVISSEKYEYGTAKENIVLPDDPVKDDDEYYTYTFAGWTPEIANVTEDATYTATYTKTPIYEVIWAEGGNPSIIIPEFPDAALYTVSVYREDDGADSLKTIEIVSETGYYDLSEHFDEYGSGTYHVTVELTDYDDNTIGVFTSTSKKFNKVDVSIVVRDKDYAVLENVNGGYMTIEFAGYARAVSENKAFYLEAGKAKLRFFPNQGFAMDPGFAYHFEGEPMSGIYTVDHYELNITDDVYFLLSLRQLGPAFEVILESALDENIYEVDGNMLVCSNEEPLKAAYYQDGQLVKLQAIDNGDGTHSYEVPQGVKEVVLVLKGDVNLDGKLTNADSTKLKAAVKGMTAFTDIQNFAGDVNDDEGISNADSTKLKAVIKGMNTLSW